MNSPRETDDCLELKALYGIYSIPRAAALWCNVPEDKVEDIIQKSKLFSTPGTGFCIWMNPNIECLEYRSRAISIAIGNYDLRCVGPDGKEESSCAEVLPEYRYILGRDLKNWIEKTFPDEKPAFLFSDAELNSYAVKSNVYRKLEKERDDLKKRLEEASEIFNALKEDNKSIKAKFDALKTEIDKAGIPSERSEITYQNIIAALLCCLSGKVKGAVPHPSFVNKSNKFVDTKVMEAILDTFPDTNTLSMRTFQRHFPRAKRSFKSY